jgi:hypothetical protein
VSARRGLLAWVLLAFALVFAAACGSNETQKQGVPMGAGSMVVGAGDAPRTDQGHLGPGSIRCAHCHTPDDRRHPQWRETAMKLGHDVKARLDERTTCNCCHLGVVKGFGEPLDRVCAECHDNVRVTITAMGKMHCLSCHDPSGNGGMSIRQSAWECTKCHSQAQGDKPAIAVHSTQACSNCHHPHSEPWTIPRQCTECHEGHETFHGAAARDADGGAPHAIAPHKTGTLSGEPMACATCHRPHEVGGMASGRCYECHAQRDPVKFTPAATFAGGHERCTTCHAPHGGDKAIAGPRECRSCHAAIATLDGRASEAHGKCVNCHQPHDVRGTPKSACVGCHLTVHPEHPDPEGNGCVGCHDPHPGDATRAFAIALGSPLPRASSFPRAPSPVVCSRCHTKASSDLGFHAGKTACIGCHTPHAFSAAKAPACSTCHAPQATAAVAATAAGGHGHGECKSCHEAHAPKAARPTCGSCHVEEQKTAPAGHADCRACHDAHPSSRAPKTSCTTCHAPKKAGPHAAVACASCHRAHGPDAPTGPPGPASRPACLSCHTPAKLGGLHAAPGHATCSSCHSAHAPPSSARATCLPCHSDRKAHEPTAAVCSGCHGFAKPR